MINLLYICCGVDVYDRLVQKGKRPGFFQLLATQTVSAVWHVSINTLCMCEFIALVVREYVIVMKHVFFAYLLIHVVWYLNTHN